MNASHIVKRGIVGLTLAALASGGLRPGRLGAGEHRPSAAHLVPRG